MWYMPYLRVRHAVIVYSCIALGIACVAIALRFWPGNGHVVMDSRDMPTVDLSMLISGSAALVGGLATVLGLNLAAENDGHLEVAWTRPISRAGYALGVFAVDIVAIVVCIGVCVICGVVVADVYIGRQAVTLGSPQAMLTTLAFCGAPLCIYAWVTALSASFKRNRGAIAGAFWPLMLVLAVMKGVPIPAVHALFGAIDLFNPLTVFSSSSGTVATHSGQAHMVIASDAVPNVIWNYCWGWLVSAGLLGIAVVQWRRIQL